MPKVVVCSICSREKAPDTGAIPAKVRYQGSHISKVERIAEESGLPFFILSGKLGFISGEASVLNYDHLLTKEAVGNLSQKIAKQLIAAGVEKIHFYTKTKENWQPYLDTLKGACGRAKVVLRVHELAGND